MKFQSQKEASFPLALCCHSEAMSTGSLAAGTGQRAKRTESATLWGSAPNPYPTSPPLPGTLNTLCHLILTLPGRNVKYYYLSFQKMYQTGKAERLSQGPPVKGRGRRTWISGLPVLASFAKAQRVCLQCYNLESLAELAIHSLCFAR